MKKELIGLLICTLLVTVAVAPGINALAVTENKIDEINEQTRTFTDEELKALERLMDEINNKLDNAKTWEETKAVLKWAVIELDKFDLLPDGMSIKEAQRLMISIYQSKEASTSDEGTLIANKVCNPVGSSMPFAPLGNGGLIDNVDIYCRGPYLFQIIIRECVFTVSFLNNNNELINLKLEVNVTTPDGTLLFHPGDPFYAWLNPGHEGNVQYWTFIDFRKARHLFGFFDINVKFTVRDDGSERREVFHCLIFGISAIIFNPEGEIIDESIDESGNQNTQSSSFQKAVSGEDFTGLEKIINDLITRFHDAETKEEKISILKELIVVLDEYDLLPEDVTVEEAQQLIVSGYQDVLPLDNLQINNQGGNDVLFDESVLPGQQSVTTSNGDLIDNVEIKCMGTTSLIDLLLALLGLPVYTIEVKLRHTNNVSISGERHFKLVATRGNRVLYEFDHDFPFKLPPNHALVTFLFTTRAWKEKGYTFGRFDLEYHLHIPDDGSSKTWVFHGFVFKIGAIIFNPEGEVIDGSGNQNIQSNPSSTQPSTQQFLNSFFFQILQRLMNTR